MTTTKQDMAQKQYVAYYRVSTKKQKRSGLGLASQKAIIDHFVKHDSAIIVEEFTEPQSGKNIENRSVLKKAINYSLRNDCFLIVAL